MKSRILTIVLTLCIVLSTSLAFAAAPELRGTWKGESSVHRASGLVKGMCAFVIDNQEGSQFRGYKLYFNDKKVLQKELLVGIYGEDGRLYFAEGVDGYGFGYLSGKQAMNVHYLESGATAKTIVYKLERVHFTTGFVEIDKDGNSVIMRAEIVNHYPLNAERIIKEADKDNDGKLTKKEWDDWKKANSK